LTGNSVVVVGELPPRAGGGLREALLSAGISERLLPLLDLTLEYVQIGAAGEGVPSLAPPQPGGAGSSSAGPAAVCAQHSGAGRGRDRAEAAAVERRAPDRRCAADAARERCRGRRLALCPRRAAAAR
jgi:hypothetical protein